MNDATTLGGWFACSWATVKRNPRPMIGGSILLTIFLLIPELSGLLPAYSCAGSAGPAYGFLAGISAIVSMAMGLIFTPVLTVGYCYLVLRVTRGETATVVHTFSAFSRFWTALGAALLYGLIVCGGTILLVVPGLIWGAKYLLCLFAVMDKQMSASESIRFSGSMTLGYKGRLVILLVADLLSCLAWYIPLVLGIQRIGDEIGPVILGASAVPLLAYGLLINPLLTGAIASAYDCICKREELKG